MATGTVSPSRSIPPSDPNALRALVARTVRNELDSYEQRTGLRDVVSGIGYVFGTWGVVMMVMRHRKRNAGPPGA